MTSNSSRWASRLVAIILIVIALSAVHSQENSTSGENTTQPDAPLLIMQDESGLYEDIDILSPPQPSGMLLDDSAIMAEADNPSLNSTLETSNASEPPLPHDEGNGTQYPVVIDDFSFELVDSIVVLEGEDGSRVEFEGINMSQVTDAYIGPVFGADTHAIALNEIDVESAMIRLAKVSIEDIDKVAYCDDYDFISFACPEWVDAGIPFEQNESAIWFEVDYMGAYAGLMQEDVPPLPNITQNITLANASAVAWDSADSMPYGGKAVYVSNMTQFFANYTSNNQVIEGASCRIGLQGSESQMQYDAAKRLHVYARTFQSSGQVSYSILCQKPGLRNASAAGSLTVLPSPVPNVTIVDADKDGSPKGVDCNDNDATVSPLKPEILYNSKDDDCNPATPDYINVEVTASKQAYIPREQATIMLIAPKNSDTYLTIDSPTNFSYVYIYTNYTYPVVLPFSFTGKTGTYTVEAINTYQGFTVTKSMQFEVANNMAAEIDMDEGYFTGDNISFIAEVQGGAGQYTYLWNFGDGTQSALASPTHKYTTPKLYNIVLVVKDAEGNQLVRSKQIRINPKYKVVFKVQDSKNSSAIPGARVRLDGDDLNTNSTGHALFYLTNRTYELRVTKDGYDRYSDDIRINGSVNPVVKLALEDAITPPMITLLSPADNAEVGAATRLRFKVQDEGKTNCTLFLSGGDGWWSEEETIPNINPGVEYEFSADLSQEEYLWKIQCKDQQGISVYSSSRKIVVKQSGSSGSGGSQSGQSGQQGQDGSQDVGTYDQVAAVMDLAPDFESMTPDQKRAVEMLGLVKRVDDIKTELERVNRDLFNLRYRSDPEEIISENEALARKLRELKEAMPVIISIERKSDFIKYIKDEDAQDAIEEYISLKGMDPSKREKERFIEANILLQKKATIRNEAYNVHIEYQSGKKEDLTLFIKQIDVSGIDGSSSIVEYIPQGVAADPASVVMITTGFESIGGAKPVYEFTSDVKEIAYYVGKKVSLELAPQARTMVLTGDIPETSSLSSITGFAVFEKPGSPNIKIFALEMVVIAGLLGVFIYNNVKYGRSESAKDQKAAPVAEGIKAMNRLIEEIDGLLKENRLREAGLKYAELKILFNGLEFGSKDVMYQKIKDICGQINTKYVCNLIDNAHVCLGKGDIESALKKYDEINEEYSTLDEAAKEKIYPRCCELIALLGQR